MSAHVLLRIEAGRVVERVEAGAAADLARLARGEGHVAWYDRRLEPWLRDPATWPELLRHQLEVLHLGCLQRTDLAVRDLGRVDFDSPFLMPGSEDRYPTWLAGPAAGIASAALVRAVGIEPRRELAPALLDFGRRAHREGLFLYSEPALLARPVPEEVRQALRFKLDRRELTTLIARGYGRRWLAFWALANALFDRSLPLSAAITGWVAPPPPAVQREALARLHPDVDPGCAAGQEVDAVIPTLGRPGPLRNLLEDLATQTVPPRRVVVVDQRLPGARLAPPADLDSAWPFELLVRTVDRAGACRARNLALREVRSPWVLLLDDDVRLPADTVALLVAMARAYGVGAVNASVYLPHQEAEAGKGDLPRVWSTFGAGAALVETAALRKAGLFDERLEGGYGEDAEIGIRLRRAGCNVLYASAVRVLHLKAPVGGFRHDFRFPWHGEKVQPRPSPIALYARNKHATLAMRQGYRLFYVLNRLRSVPALARPGELFRALRRWKRSAHWAERLEKGTGGVA